LGTRTGPQLPPSSPPHHSLSWVRVGVQCATHHSLVHHSLAFLAWLLPCYLCLYLAGAVLPCYCLYLYFALAFGYSQLERGFGFGCEGDCSDSTRNSTFRQGKPEGDILDVLDVLGLGVRVRS
jgi:hypothetical protein